MHSESDRKSLEMVDSVAVTPGAASSRMMRTTADPTGAAADVARLKPSGVEVSPPPVHKSEGYQELVADMSKAPVDLEKVAALREAVAAGTYELRPDDVARAMLASENIAPPAGKD